MRADNPTVRCCMALPSVKLRKNDESRDDAEADGLTARERVLWLWAAGTVGVVTLASFAFGNSATKIAVACVGVLALLGLWRGAARIAPSLAGVIVGMLLAHPVGRLIEPIVERLTGTTGFLGRLTSVALAGLILSLVISVGLAWPIRRFVAKRATLRLADKFVGGALGAGEGLLVALAVFWGLQSLAPFVLPPTTYTPEWAGAMDGNGSTGTQTTPPSRAQKPEGLAVVLAPLAQAARESVFAPLARLTSPISGEMMNIMEEFAAVSRSKPAMQHFLASEPLRKLGESELLMKSLAELKQEPDLVALVERGEVSPQALLAAMRNKRVLAMLDDPAIGTELKSHAGNISLALRAAAKFAKSAPAEPVTPGPD